MKKIKLFEANLTILGALQSLSIVKGRADLENDVNEFLAHDGKDIKVLDVKYQSSAIGSTVIETVCVYYEEINSK